MAQIRTQFARTAHIAAVAISVMAASCTAAPPEAGTPPPQETTSNPAGTVLPPQAPDQLAVAAYRGMWQTFFTAATTSDWQSPKLGQHATGIALTTLARSLATDSNNGLVTKGEPTLSPRVSSMEPAESPRKVIVTDCSDSSKSLKYRRDSGQPANDTPGGRRRINAVVEKQTDGSWKVSDFGVHEVGSC